MQKITPFLWFDGHAEEAAKYYVSVFREGRILRIARFGDAGPGPKGAVMTVSFELFGQQFTALNGGPQFPFTEAISLVVSCPTQEEIDRLWDTLARDGGRPPGVWLDQGQVRTRVADHHIATLTSAYEGTA